jgi:hypothetical protein
MPKLNEAGDEYNHTQTTKCLDLHSTHMQASNALQSSVRTVKVIHKEKR